MSTMIPTCLLRLKLLEAYFKMQNVLVDDRRIWVDLSVFHAH